ncbi:MAG: hypothetical protein WKF55_15895 [Gemmatimonadaceae bacterium]
MRAQEALIVFAIASACNPAQPNEPPARIVAGSSDTIIINNRAGIRIPIRVLDVSGKTLPDSDARFRLVNGREVRVSTNGIVTCTRSVDANVEVTIGALHKSTVIRCRPVKKVYIAGPIQFLLPDTAQEMRMNVLDLDGSSVSLLSGTPWIRDTTIATIDGIRVIPKSPGVTLAKVRFGNESGWVGVHVYERATSLDGLARGKESLGIPVRLKGNERQS